MRRAWIEIFFLILPTITSARSPSVRRAWIEIVVDGRNMFDVTSPSVRRAWIEIQHTLGKAADIQVALREEGVD